MRQLCLENSGFSSKPHILHILRTEKIKNLVKLEISGSKIAKLHRKKCHIENRVGPTSENGVGKTFRVPR